MTGAQRRIKVLIIDDSPMFRRVIEQAIYADPGIEVIATAQDPAEARLRIMEQKPDVITCDVEMPVLDGISFVRWLLPQLFVPVVMVSSVSDKVFDAMAAGAVDFVVKPNQLPKDATDSFGADLIRKIKAAACASATLRPIEEAAPAVQKRNLRIPAEAVIAIGASTGGTEAVFSVLKHLPASTPGIAIVQHIPPEFSRMFAVRLDSQTALSVKEAVTGDRLVPGTVLVAPGDRHMRLRKRGGVYSVECFSGEKVNGHCPSVDVLFNSVAAEAGSNAVGVILTGMGTDGAKGLLNIRRSGGHTIGQDQASSIVYGMPQAAYNAGAVEVQASLQSIPREILRVFER